MIANIDAGVMKNFPTAPPLCEEEFVFENVGRYAGSGIDALVYNMFNWDDVLPMYPTHVPEARRIDRDNFETPGDWREQVNLDWMIANDPWTSVVDAAHAHGIQFWAGMRFNDIHFRPWQSEFRANHPEYVLGEACPLGKKFGRAFNYAIPEVREHRLQIVEEVCTRYDLDGFEWDFTRHPGAHFLDYDEGREILNDYMREARALLNRIGENRGRAVGFGVRTWQTLEISYDMALDVRTWIKEGLVDYVSPSPGFGSVTNPFFKPFVDLAGGTGCRIYACTTEHMDGRWNHPREGWEATPPAVMRAGALNAWHEGVDGLYQFNIQTIVSHDVGREHRGLDVIHEIADPEALAYKDKVYSVTWCDSDIFDDEGVPPFEIDVQPDGPGKTISIYVADDLESAARLGLLESVSLRIVTGESADDVVDFTLNGRPLSRNPRTVTFPSIRQPEKPVTGNASRIFDLPAGDGVRQGLNQVNVTVRKREPRVRQKLTVFDVSLEIRYRSAPMQITERMTSE